jgi:hypothetical protein
MPEATEELHLCAGGELLITEQFECRQGGREAGSCRTGDGKGHDGALHRVAPSRLVRRSIPVEFGSAYPLIYARPGRIPLIAIIAMQGWEFGPWATALHFKTAI